MRLFVSGSAPLLTETFDAVRASAPATRILERYGMSETVDADLEPVRRQTASAAAARSACRCRASSVRVVDDERRALPGRRDRRDRGQGPERLRRLLAHAARRPREEFTADGWFQHRRRRPASTSNGYVSIVGRSKDLIITGGYNVYPAEIEGYLNDMPGVAESGGGRRAAPRLRRGGGRGGRARSRARRSTRAALIAGAEGAHRQLQGAQAGASWSTNCRATTMGKVQKNLLREQHAALFAELTSRARALDGDRRPTVASSDLKGFTESRPCRIRASFASRDGAGDCLRSSLRTMLLLTVSAIKLVAEIALMALVGQLLLGLLAGAARQQLLLSPSAGHDAAGRQGGSLLTPARCPRPPCAAGRVCPCLRRSGW